LHYWRQARNIQLSNNQEQVMILKNKIALVLGASAEKGTGWAIAERYAKEGAKVVVGARSLAPLQRLADKIEGLAVQCDVSKERDIINIANETVSKFGKIDIAVNSAGLPVMGSISSSAFADVEKAIRTNFYANYFFVKYVAENMNDNGSIIAITSVSGSNVIPPHFSYACAKAASDCLVKYAALEYGHRGIRVNSILPGPILSDMTGDFYSNPQIQEIFAKEIPLGRIAVPEDIADAALWLAGPAFATGLNLQVNGGNYLTRCPRPDELPSGALQGQGIPLSERRPV
jgi:3-oxoacyl-[acyl-carrier protein] reductase